VLKEFEKALGTDRFARWFSLCAAGCGVLALFPLTLSSPDLSVIFYVLITIPLVCFILLVVFWKHRGKQRVAALSALAIFVIFTAVLFTNFVDTRDGVRWFVYGRALKAEVVAQPGPTPGPLKHVEWDGWGFGGNDTTVYLVFDPTDTLATAANARKSGKFGSLPCEVFRIRQREKEWYTVQFYTNTDWDACGN
jgi:hypothetical protein